MIDRRSLLAGLAALPLFTARAGMAQSGNAATGAQMLIRRPIPGAGDQVPVVGIGTARRYADPASDADYAALRDTIRRFSELGGTIIDTAPSYGRAEEVVGRLVEELGIRNKLFLATKVGIEGKAAGIAQIEESFRKLRTNRIDLIAVHNLRDTATQLATLRDMKAAGRIRSVGVTTSADNQYQELEAIMRREPLDVIQVDYALDNRNAADRILPLAQEKNVAVMINLPFGRGRLLQAHDGKPLPDWAKEIGAATWAQVCLKYVVSHPSRPVAIPGTAQVRYAEDNVGAARGRLPDAALRAKMEAYIASL